MEKGGTNELAVTEQVFAGHLSSIPAEKLNEVRIYLCSTSTDMQSERNWIMKTAVPRLRRFCQERGLSFQIVDLQWGVRDEVTDDHSRTKLSLKVIQQCKNVSVGPYFVALLGDKYGNRPLVAEIEASEFKLLKNTAVELGFDISLLTAWYLCDHNREPTMYILQPITSLLPSFFDNNPVNNLQQQQAQREWITVVDKLHHLFRKVTKHLYKKKKISQETKHKYFQSVTDAEVTAGILEAAEMRNRTLCFQRTLDGISSKENVAIAGRYTDIIEKSLDLEAEKLREQLRLEKITSVLPKENLLRYNLLWDKHGLDVTENTQHKSYLERFGQDFLTAMRRMILSGIKELSALYGSSSLMEEVLHHLHLCKYKCMTFCGRELVLLEIRNKLRSVDYFIVETNKKVDGEESDKAIDQDGVHQSDKIASHNGMNDVSEFDYFNDLQEKNTCLPNGDYVKDERHEHFDEQAVLSCNNSDAEQDPKQDIYDEIEKIISAKEFATPLVIYGPSGIGKTAITAKVMELSKVWFPNCVSIIRFLGMTSMSSSIREVLHSLCLQISHVYNLSSYVSVDISDLQHLINHFKTLLWKIDTDSQPLLIVLDAVDQLTSSDHADTFNWLPVKLPPKVHLLISVVSDRLPWLRNVRSIYPKPERYVEVTKLGKNDGLDMINTYCHQHGCHLARKQSNVLLDRLEVSGSPLYLKVLIDKALSWKSYETIDKDMLGTNVSEVMNQLFDKLETKHGHVLVKHALGYLCTAKDGLTDAEMEDLLSLDNEVLQDLFIYHSPPDPDVIRIPSLLWKQLHNDICAYLIEKQCGGHRVMTWSHRLIMETASSRYLTDANRKQVNHMMAEYFQGLWSSKPKGLHLVKAKNGLFPNAHRQVPSQPIMYNVNIYNTRMLNCLSYHLIHSEKFENLLMELFTDPEWLYAKCQTLSLTALLQDFRLAEAKLAAHIQTLRDSVAKAENMMPGRKQKEELTKSTAVLKKNLDIFEAMKIVTKMILCSGEQIRKHPIYLPLQIIGQLGQSYNGMEPLEKLVNACLSWCRDCNIPMLLPLTDCLTKPGEILLYTIEVEMRITGELPKEDAGWTKNNHKKWPRLLYEDLVDYLIHRKAYDGKEMKAFRSLYAKNYVESEWLGDIYDCKAEDAHYMKAAISPSQPGIGRCDYDVWVAVLDSSVLTGNCSCPAGAGKTCSHIAALLYAVILSWEHGVAGETCTDRLQVWGRGATRVLALNDTFSEILDGTVNKKVKCDDKVSKPIQFLDHHELQTFVSHSKMKPLWNCKGTMLHKILFAPAKTFEEKVPLVHGCHDADWNLPVTEIPCASCQHFFDKFIKISKASAECLERQTKQQSSSLWMESRKIRLTASKVSSLPKTKRANPDKYVTNHIYNRFKGSAATRHGLRCEPLACKWFEEETGLTVCKSGLQIHGNEQYIAASPDGILSENSILEIKCPTKTIAELIHSDKYDIQKSPSGELFLSPKGKNGYYSQVQMTMFCTKSSICKFVVWTAEEQLILDIPYDENYVSNELSKIRKFYFQHLLPRLTDENHFGRLQLSREYKKLC